jgi:CRP-like cAMP-binding protein
MSADLKIFLKGLPAFERFEARHLDALAERLEVKTYPPGHTLMAQGGAGNAVHLIMQGNVDITRHDPVTRADQEIAESGPGEMCCILALIENMPAVVTVRARAGLTTAALSLARYNELALLAPPVSGQFQYMLAVQLARDIQRINGALREYASSSGDTTTILPGKHWRT